MEYDYAGSYPRRTPRLRRSEETTPQPLMGTMTRSGCDLHWKVTEAFAVRLALPIWAHEYQKAVEVEQCCSGCGTRHQHRGHGFLYGMDLSPRYASGYRMAITSSCATDTLRYVRRLLEGRRVSRRFARAEGLLKSCGVGAKQG
jgi:hypothetical protein